MRLRSVALWVAAVLCSGLLPQGCRPAASSAPDVIPPYTTAVPAGGIYRAWPAEIRLSVNEKATIY